MALKSTERRVDELELNKQDNLVSGVNIKTINGNSVLGSGNLTVGGGGSATWGGITGTLSNQTDLQNALDLKQDDLVSGTNIKTLEGQSLLGSGNIDLTKSDVGLSNVDNTSDLNKPISTATQTALNAKQDTLTLTTTGTSGAATLVGSTLNIPQYSGGSSNPSVISLNATNGTNVSATIDTISRSFLVPANTFTGDGMLEALVRSSKTGAAGGYTTTIYKNTTNTLTGATLIATIGSGTFLFQQAIRTFRINSNLITYLQATSAIQSDYAALNNAPSSTTFTTSVDNYIIFAIRVGNIADSARVDMARLVKYV